MTLPACVLDFLCLAHVHVSLREFVYGLLRVWVKLC